MTDKKLNQSDYMDGKIFISPDPELDLSVIDKEPSLGHRLLRKLANDRANQELYVDLSSGRKWTGKQFYDVIMNIATALLDKFDFKQGSAVCINYDHSDTAAILALAVISAGGIVACTYPLDPYAELLYLGERVRPKYYFSSKKNLHLGKKLSQDLDYHVQVVEIPDDPYNDVNCESNSTLRDFVSLTDLIKQNYQESKSKDRVPVACKDIMKDVALITMSSGTTGKPKAIPSTHFNCLADFGSRFSKEMNISFACTQSLDYVSGRIIIFGAIESGYRTIIIKSFEPKSYCQAIQDFKINLVYLGAASFYNLITFPDLEKFDLSSIFAIFPMGAPIIYLDELRDFFNKHPTLKIVRQGYGASEFSGAAMNAMTPEEYLLDVSNCGYLLPSVKVKIVDPETGELLGKGKEGLLHISTPRLFPGYYDLSRTLNKENYQDMSPIIRDSSVFDEDGYYKSGDLAYFDQDYKLHIIGRQKELMNCRGSKKVLPQELEELIDQHPAVEKVCVLGVPNKVELTLHCPRAFIVPKDEYYSDVHLKTNGIDSKNDDDDVKEKHEQLVHKGNHKLCRMSRDGRRKLAEDIMDFVDQRIGWEKQLTGGIVILDDLDTSRSTGKVDKNFLRRLGPDEIEIYGDRSE